MSGDDKATVDSRIEAMKAQLDQLTNEHGKLTVFETELVKLMRASVAKYGIVPGSGWAEGLNAEVKKEKPVLTAAHARGIWAEMERLIELHSEMMALGTRYNEFVGVLDIVRERCEPFDMKRIMLIPPKKT